MLREDLNDSLKRAMKEKDSQCVATVRLILAALKDRDIQARGNGNSDGVPEADILEMLRKMVKQRREAMEMYRQGRRQDLVEKEAAEIAVIERFLPKPMDEEATARVIGDLIEELEADSIKDMGRVMSTLKERFAGRMDFSRASALVKELLA